LNVLKQNIELKGDTLEVLGLKDKPYNIGQDIPGSRILGLKLQEVYKFINTKNDDDVIVFMDAFDVYFSGDKLTLLKRYKEMNKPIVFGAEPSCYPDGDKAQYYPKTNSYFRFLNSGLFIGRVKELKECMNNYSHEFIDEINDQLWWTNKFLERQDIIELDYNQHLFLNCVWLQDSELICNEGKVTFHNKTPLIISLTGEREWAYLYPLVHSVRLVEALSEYRLNGLPFLKYYRCKNFALKYSIPHFVLILLNKTNPSYKNINLFKLIFFSLLYPNFYLSIFYYFNRKLKMVLKKIIKERTIGKN
jgi:hypothetical protein